MKNASQLITKILYNMMANYTNNNILASKGCPHPRREKKKKTCGNRTGHGHDSVCRLFVCINLKK